MGSASVFVVAFLGAAVEVIEMVIIIVGVGAVRGWRSTWLGTAAGLAVLAVLVLALGSALQAVPIGVLRLVVGTLLLIFGLQWLRKGIQRVAANGLRGTGSHDASAEDVPATGVDWTAFVLTFKGVVLEGLEVAFIVLSVGLAGQMLGSAVLGAVAAFVVIAGAGVLARRSVERIPRSALQLVVGTLLSSFGTFWSVEGLNVSWPGSEVAILVLIGWYVLIGAVYIRLIRQRAGSHALQGVSL